MDGKLISLRQREIEALGEFLKAQRAYLKTTALSARKSEAELKEAAEEYLRTAELYETALQELREYLLAVEKSETMAMELVYAERLINALHKTIRACTKLFMRHTQLIGRHAEDEEE